MLSLRHVTVQYPSTFRPALQNISITASQSFSILGPSGSGKSSLLKAMMGLVPFEGDILWDNTHLGGDPMTARRGISYMPQENSLPQDLTVGEFLTELLEMNGTTVRMERSSSLHAILSLVHLDHSVHQRLRWLSGGMKRRAVLAAALTRRTPWLFLDEPTQGLDPDEQAYVRALIGDLARERLVVLSTQEADDASAIPERVVVLSAGHLVIDTSLEQIQAAARGHVRRVFTTVDDLIDTPFWIPDPTHQAIKCLTRETIEPDHPEYVQPSAYEGYLWLLRETE